MVTEPLDERAYTSEWGGLIAVLRRVLAGERNAAPLRAGLDPVDTAVVDRVLDILKGPGPVADERPDS